MTGKTTMKPIEVVMGARVPKVDMQEVDPDAAARYWDLQARIDEARAALREYETQQNAVVDAFRRNYRKS